MNTLGLEAKASKVWFSADCLWLALSDGRQLAVPLAHPAKPDLKVLASPMRFSATPVSYRSPPPLLGQHTEEVLKGLGMDAAAIEVLRKDKVI